MKDFSP
jgi:hypothetical protein